MIWPFRKGKPAIAADSDGYFGPPRRLVNAVTISF
jgi:hypothetical protein